MSRISRRKLAVVLGLLVIVAAPSTLLANHSWGGYHWARTSDPFTLKLGNNVSSAWLNEQYYFPNGFLGKVSYDWSQSTVLDTTVVSGGTTNQLRRCRPTSGRVEVCATTYGYNGWLGEATIWVSGGTHITQATVKLNDSWFNTVTYNTPGWRSLVACQEIGHTFGLDHQDETFDNANLGTCMDYTDYPVNNPDGSPDNTSPNQGDYDELLCIYDPASNGSILSTSTRTCTGTGHVDDTTTVGQTTNMPNAMTDLDLEGPGQRGVSLGNPATTAVCL